MVGLLGIAAIAAYIKYAPADKIPNDLRQVQTSPSPSPTAPQKIDVIQPHATGPDIDFTRKSGTSPAGADPVVTAVNLFLDRCPFVPHDARALSASVKDRVALIDFSSPFEQTYGTTDEEALLQGLQRSVGQFKNIDSVILAVNGHHLDTLGNVEINDGFTVIRPDGSEPAKPSEAPPSPAPN